MIETLSMIFLVISIILFIATIVFTLKADRIIREPQKKNKPSKERSAKDKQKKAAGESGSVVINLVISPNHFHVIVPEDDLEENNFYNDRFRGYED